MNRYADQGLRALVRRDRFAPRIGVTVGVWQPSTARDQIAQLNVDYGNFDREVKMLATVTPQFLRGWNDWLGKWSAFYVDNQAYFAVTPLNVESKLRDTAMYREALQSWRDAFRREAGKAPQTPGPVTPPPPGGKPPVEPLVAPWIVSLFAVVGLGSVAYAAYSGFKNPRPRERRK